MFGLQAVAEKTTNRMPADEGHAVLFLWPPNGIGQAIIFYGFYLLSSVVFFLSSPNLSRRRLDVYHTCAHGVALVRI